MKWERVECKDRGIDSVSEKRKLPRRKVEKTPGRRWGHTVNAVRNGRYVYVFGGYAKEGRQTNEVHIFDTIRSAWTKPNVKGAVPSARDSHTSIVFENKLFVFGGTDGVSGLNDLYTLETTNNTWEKCACGGEVPSPREGHAGAKIGKKMYIFGGCGKNSPSHQDIYYNDVYVLDTTTLIWTLANATGKIPSARDSHSCVSYNNKLYIYGGIDFSNSFVGTVYCFDSDTLEWSEMVTTGDNPHPRAGHAAVVLQNFMIVFGGFANEKVLFNDLYFLDLNTGVWESKKVLEVNSLPHSPSTSSLSSPHTPSSPSASPSSNSSQPSPRFSLSCDIIDNENGKVLFYGGCDSNFHPLQDMYILHTDIISQGGMMGDATNTHENLPLKRKLSETSFDSNASPNGKRLAECKEKTTELKDSESKNDEYFEGKIIDINPYGYFIEAEINNKKLKGFFFGEEKEMMNYFKSSSEESMKKVPGKRGRKKKIKPPELPPPPPIITQPVPPNTNHELNFLKPDYSASASEFSAPKVVSSSLSDPIFKIDNEGDCVVLTLDTTTSDTHSKFVTSDFLSRHTQKQNQKNRVGGDEDGEDTDTDKEESQSTTLKIQSNPQMTLE